MKQLAKIPILLAVLMMVVAPASLSAQDKTIKRKVAIGRFSNETQYAKGLFYDKENDPMRKQALDRPWTSFLPNWLPAESSFFSKGTTLISSSQRQEKA